jgi:hypothetical protein
MDATPDNVASWPLAPSSVQQVVYQSALRVEAALTQHVCELMKQVRAAQDGYTSSAAPVSDSLAAAKRSDLEAALAAYVQDERRLRRLEDKLDAVLQPSAQPPGDAVVNRPLVLAPRLQPLVDGGELTTGEGASELSQKAALLERCATQFGEAATYADRGLPDPSVTRPVCTTAAPHSVSVVVASLDGSQPHQHGPSMQRPSHAQARFPLSCDTASQASAREWNRRRIALEGEIQRMRQVVAAAMVVRSRAVPAETMGCAHGDDVHISLPEPLDAEAVMARMFAAIGGDAPATVGSFAQRVAEVGRLQAASTPEAMRIATRLMRSLGHLPPKQRRQSPHMRSHCRNSQQGPLGHDSPPTRSLSPISNRSPTPPGSECSGSSSAIHRRGSAPSSGACSHADADGGFSSDDFDCPSSRREAVESTTHLMRLLGLAKAASCDLAVDLPEIEMIVSRETVRRAKCRGGTDNSWRAAALTAALEKVAAVVPRGRRTSTTAAAVTETPDRSVSNDDAAIEPSAALGQSPDASPLYLCTDGALSRRRLASGTHTAVGATDDGARREGARSSHSMVEEDVWGGAFSGIDLTGDSAAAVADPTAALAAAPYRLLRRHKSPQAFLRCVRRLVVVCDLIEAGVGPDGLFQHCISADAEMGVLPLLYAATAAAIEARDGRRAQPTATVARRR